MTLKMACWKNHIKNYKQQKIFKEFIGNKQINLLIKKLILGIYKKNMDRERIKTISLILQARRKKDMQIRQPPENKDCKKEKEKIIPT